MGGPDVPQRNLTQELGDITQGFKGNVLPLFNQWFNKQPLLGQSRDLALSGLTSIGGPAIAGLAPIIASMGKLTPEQERDVALATRTGFAQRGNLMGNQALGAELLNRDVYRQQRFGTALNQAISALTGTISPALGTEQAAVGTFASLLDPLYGFGSDVFSSNQNAAAAQNIMGANKTSGLAGAGATIGGAALLAL